MSRTQRRHSLKMCVHSSFNLFVTMTAIANTERASTPAGQQCAVREQEPPFLYKIKEHDWFIGAQTERLEKWKWLSARTERRRECTGIKFSTRVTGAVRDYLYHLQLHFECTLANVRAECKLCSCHAPVALGDFAPTFTSTQITLQMTQRDDCCCSIPVH